MRIVKAVAIGLLVLAMGFVGCGDDAAPAGDARRDGPSDGPRPDAFGICDPVLQDCVTGQRCTLNHTQPSPMLFCESAPGTVMPYQGCTPTQSSDDCQKGSVCLMTGQTRTCRRFCYQDTDCGNDYCAIGIGGTPLYACAQRCDVLMQNCATTGEACYLGETTSRATTQQCSNQGTLGAGQPCTIANDCARGLICFHPSDADAAGFHCYQACNTMAGGTPACTAGTCTAIMGQEATHLGYCR